MNIRYGFAGTALALFTILITFIMCINVQSRVQSSALHDRNLQRRRRGRRPFKRSFAQNNNNLNRMTMENVTCHFYTQPLDHFSSSTDLTFQQRYCVYDGFTNSSSKTQREAGDTDTAPIFFYTGNESPIDEYVNNTGLMFELAAKDHFSALVVFAEHRYEGKSIPDFTTMAERGIGCFAYLASSQALADFASLISYLNPNHDRPVIAFGGSYGGMLSSYLRMKYPGTVLGAIASSAPIFGLPLTMSGDITTREKGGMPNSGTMDSGHYVVGNGVRLDMPGASSSSSRDRSKGEVGDNHCFDNLLAAWPLMQYYGDTEEGREVLSKEFNLCHPIEDSDDVVTLIEWAQTVWFDLAEGDYPYKSSYIPYALGEGHHELPAWPLQEACLGASGLSQNMNISIIGDKGNVRFDVIYGDGNSDEGIVLHIDWDRVKQDGESLLSGNKVANKLFSAVRDAVGIWYNVTGSLDCFDAVPAINQEEHSFPAANANLRSTQYSRMAASSNRPEASSSSSRHDVCLQKLEYETVWSSLVCNENMNLIMTYAQGVGRDFYWPPSHDKNQHSYKDTCANRTFVEDLYEESCSDPNGIFGYPDKSSADPDSRFLDDYYGGLRIGDHSNIIFSNGMLDPWSAAGVYSKDSRIQNGSICSMEDVEFDCSLVQNVTKDGGIIALILDLGAHHLDLMYSDDEDPTCVREGRLLEEAYIHQWIEQWRETKIDSNSGLGPISPF